MDELIILLIKGIIRLMSGPDKRGLPQQRVPIAPALQQQRIPPSVTPRPQSRPANAAQARRPLAPPPRQQGRRPAPTMVAVAAPIITSAGGDMDASPRTTKPTQLPAAQVAHHVAAVDTRAWFTPAALRRQIVVSEILGKPLALRTDR